MDYDKTDIPNTYDAARQYDSARLEAWLNRIAGYISPENISTILDLGCGTGRYSAALAKVFGATVTGVEPSEKMLAHAKEKHADKNITFLRAPGEEIPIDDQSIDMVFMSMVYHHLNDPPVTAAECARVVKTPGYVAIVNSTSDQAESFPYVGFFSGVEDVIRQHQPSTLAVKAVFNDAGFALINHQVVKHMMAEDWQSFVKKVRLRADSILARLPQEDFQKGVEALEVHADTASGCETVNVNIDLFIFRNS